jgi:hypothetical protein
VRCSRRVPPSVSLTQSATRLSEDGFTCAMIHELAHFTGPVDGILDHAYFHKNPHRYRNLSHELAFGNADSYSQFAFETIGKPDFDASA